VLDGFSARSEANAQRAMKARQRGAESNSRLNVQRLLRVKRLTKIVPNDWALRRISENGDKHALPVFETARILVRLGHGPGFVKHADDCAVRARVALSIIDGVGSLEIPQPAKR
jgi:hypothetical protein